MKMIKQSFRKDLPFSWGQFITSVQGSVSYLHIIDYDGGGLDRGEG
jgi:hypothetical protein